MAGKHVRTWALFGKVAFVLSVLWFVGLMFNFMLLSEFIFGAGLLCYDLVSRFRRSSKHAPKFEQEQYRKVRSHQTSLNKVGEPQFVRVYDADDGGD